MSFEAMSEEQLMDHLHQEAAKRGCEFHTRAMETTWRAALFVPDTGPLGTQTVRWSAEASERKDALVALAHELEQDPA